MSGIDETDSEAVFDLAKQLAIRPDTVTLTVHMDRWGRRKISVDLQRLRGADARRALLHSYMAAEVQEREHFLTGVIRWRNTDIPVSVFVAAGEPE